MSDSSPEESADRQPYSVDQTKRSIFAFATGRGVVALSGFLYTVLVATHLPKEDYAVFVILMGAALLARQIFGFGIEGVVTRFLPELCSEGISRQALQFLGKVTYVRFLTGGCCCLLVALAATPISVWFRSPDHDDLFRFWALVLFFRLVFSFYRTAMGCLMWHRISAGIWGAVWLIRTGGVVGHLLVTRDIGLFEIVAYECFCQGLGLFWSLWAYATKAYGVRDCAEEGLREVNSLHGRVARFALYTYGTGLLGVLSTRGGLRFILATTVGAPVVAVFGFSQSIVGFVRRYSPQSLFANITVPVLTAGFVKSADYKMLAARHWFVLKLNLILVAGLIVAMVVAGEQIASAMSGGRYSDASPIVLLLLALLCVELHGTVLVDLANVSEANRSKLISSLVPSLFLIPAIFTVEKGGVTVLLGWLAAGRIAAQIMFVHG